MPYCVIFSGNDVVSDPVQADPCSVAAVLTADEYTQLTASPTLLDIFSVPLAEDLAQLWLVGFSLPIIIYLSAWALGVVVNFINTH